MKVRSWWVLARAVVVESVRRKDFWVLAILGLVIVASAGLLGFFGLKSLQVFAKDLAFTVLGAFSSAVAVLTSCRMLPEEIRNRTLYPLLARPLTRADLLVGKFLGSVLVSWLAFAVLAVMVAVSLLVFGVSFELIMLQYVVAKSMGLALICAISMTLSLLMTPPAAATVSFLLVFGSGMITRALVMGFAEAPAAFQPALKLFSLLIPQYPLFDLGGRAANVGWSPVPAWVLCALLMYLAVYGGAMLMLSWLSFRRKAI